jgi:hypothetical protein
MVYALDTRQQHNTLPRVYKTCTDRFSEFSKIRGLRAGILKPYDRQATAIPAPPLPMGRLPDGGPSIRRYGLARKQHVRETAKTAVSSPDITL